MADPVDIIFEYGTAEDTGLFTLVGTRFWSPVPPADATFTNKNAAIIYHYDGRVLPFNVRAHNTCNAVFKCYGGGGFDDARDVLEALVDRFHGKINQVTASGTIMWSHLVSANQPQAEPGTNSPVAIASFAILISC